jgi:hypothetical protein
LHASLKNGHGAYTSIHCEENLPPGDLGKRVRDYIATGVKLMEDFAAWVAQNEKGARLAIGRVGLDMTVLKGVPIISESEHKGAYADGRSEPKK